MKVKKIFQYGLVTAHLFCNAMAMDVKDEKDGAAKSLTFKCPTIEQIKECAKEEQKIKKQEEQPSRFFKFNIGEISFKAIARSNNYTEIDSVNRALTLTSYEKTSIKQPLLKSRPRPQSQLLQQPLKARPRPSSQLCQQLLPPPFVVQFEYSPGFEVVVDCESMGINLQNARCSVKGREDQAYHLIADPNLEFTIRWQP